MIWPKSSTDRRVRGTLFVVVVEQITPQMSRPTVPTNHPTLAVVVYGNVCPPIPVCLKFVYNRVQGEERNKECEKSETSNCTRIQAHRVSLVPLRLRTKLVKWATRRSRVEIFVARFMYANSTSDRKYTAARSVERAAPVVHG